MSESQNDGDCVATNEAQPERLSVILNSALSGKILRGGKKKNPAISVVINSTQRSVPANSRQQCIYPRTRKIMLISFPKDNRKIASLSRALLCSQKTEAE